MRSSGWEWVLPSESGVEGWVVKGGTPGRAAQGEEIVIAKSGKPKARLVPLDDTRPLRRPGQGRGAWQVRDDFDAPLPDEIRQAFGDEEP